MSLEDFAKGLESVDAPLSLGCGTNKTSPANTGCC